MVLRQTATGRRYEDSVDHESGSAENPDDPWVNTVPEKRKIRGMSPVTQRVHVLGAGNLEVIGALDRQVELRGPVEPAHHRRDVRPQEGTQGVPPLGGLAEQLVEFLLLLLAVATALRLDPDLASQGRRMHALPVRLLCPGPEHDRRRGGVRLRPGVDHLELEVGHWARAPMSVKKSSSFRLASLPPSKPRQSILRWPTSS